MIVTDLDDYCNDRWFQEGAENVLFAILSRSSLAPTQSPVDCLMLEKFSQGKGTDFEPDHFHPSSNEG